MQIICVDDHPILLKGLINMIRELLPEADINGFLKADEAYRCAKVHGCDILFCEIALYGNGGMTLAEQIKAECPKANIIFATVCSEKEHAKEVMDVRPSGYITKPVTKDRVLVELQNLRYPVTGCLV